MDSFWNHGLRHFEKALPAQQYKTWIQPLQAHLDGENIVVSAPNRFVLEWVKDKFLDDRNLHSKWPGAVHTVRIETIFLITIRSVEGATDNLK